jgi:hypothetical protein
MTVRLRTINDTSDGTRLYHLMHILLHACDTNKFAFSFVVRITFVKTRFAVETMANLQLGVL